MRCIKQLVLATTLIASCTSVFGFDGNRKGFMMGIAGGFHSTELDIQPTGSPSQSASESGVQFRLMVGAGISEKLTIYGLYDFQWGDDAAYGLVGPGATFYFSDHGPSAYLFAGPGYAMYTEKDQPRNNYIYETATGFGMLLGGGYAFTKNLHLEGSLTHMNVSDRNSYADDIDYELTSLRVSIGYSWF
ncbi:hypothetical protein [Granulosicoccus antarcticus]|uniref:Outer membrane protein beta-barrel domain-containing protein n=1 Tax=Granulosicoccus antarcticus IMCC3135 TaxID=1192854 RepID=A0A2Z2NUU4_9GAMM|nr:hypothetical protein [Granulosicoccus antarcticus]ASJ75256.1 hypothetical protein IMCC3135_26005 [Granulosicoccus antarcticus IMCC3135]